MTYGPILTLSPHAIDLALSWETANPLNPVLRPSASYPEPGDAEDDPAAELKQANLVERDGRAAAQLFDLLPALSTAATLEYIADYRLDNRKYTALSACAGNCAVLALRERDLDAGTDIVRFREIDADQLVDALLDLLELTPGKGPLLGVYLEDVRAQTESVTERRMSYEHKQLQLMLERPVTGPAVEITIGMRDDARTYRYTERPLHIANLDWGAFLSYNIGDGRDEMFWGGPATREHVHKGLSALRRTLTAPEDT